MSEIWKPIKGQNGAYEVSSEGRVRRVVGKWCKAERFIKARPNGNGYQFVTLLNRRSYYVHCLVAEAFIGHRPARHDVNHKNGVKHDNRIENLEFATRAMNMLHARQIGLHKNFADGHYNAKLTSERVRKIRNSNASSKMLARRFRVSGRTINDVRKQLTWKTIK